MSQTSTLPRSSTEAQPWQLQMFHRSLKKQQKLKALLAILGDVAEERCLLLTCGDNNGALNWYFRAHGGTWSWGDVMAENLEEMSRLLDEPVHETPADSLPFADHTFDHIVAIDVLEHLPDDQPFLREVHRILQPTGQAVITVPNGDPQLLANRIKWRVGMTPEIYGHTRAGYTTGELRQAMSRAGFAPHADGGYSRFFTEMMELIINFGYVFMLSRKQGGDAAGQIAPTTSGELKTYGLAYRLYGFVYPIMNLISKLDALMPMRTNNAVIVAGHKAARSPHGTESAR